MPHFKSIWKIPLAGELLIISVITGVKVGTMSQRRIVDIGSSAQDAFEKFLMTEIISESVAFLKDSN